MQNMLVAPAGGELEVFYNAKPFVIFNAGVFPRSRQTDRMTFSTPISVSFGRKE